jgi:hypothetical protein
MAESLDPDQFILSLRQFAETVPERFLALHREIAVNLFAEIVSRTPVDTGYARANWWPSVTNPSAEITGPRFEQGIGGDAAAALSLARLADSLGALPAYGVFWIANNVEYIGALEDGHSGQAPEGMVRVSIADIRQTYGLGG